MWRLSARESVLWSAGQIEANSEVLESVDIPCCATNRGKCWEEICCVDTTWLPSCRLADCGECLLAPCVYTHYHSLSEQFVFIL